MSSEVLHIYLAGEQVKTVPTSEHEWTIHSVNIQGIFFQRWCEKVLAESKEWKLKSVNYSVEFPPPNGPFRGRESNLDIRAETRRDETILTLLVECKKNNPEFINWIFFPKRQEPSLSPVVLPQLDNLPRQAPAAGWDVQSSLKSLAVTIQVADEALETRGSYLEFKKGDKTKTSNTAISDAAYQIALATQAILLEEEKFSRALGALGTPGPIPWLKQVILPTIVTSARIFTCDFDPGDVDPATREIPYDKAHLEERPFALFEYPLPKHLQSAPATLVDTLNAGKLEWFMRMHIIVVHSARFASVLPQFADMVD